LRRRREKKLTSDDSFNFAAHVKPQVGYGTCCGRTPQT
jgi:hypothetical protein